MIILDLIQLYNDRRDFGILTSLQSYSTYTDFANRYGHPDAAIYDLAIHDEWMQQRKYAYFESSEVKCLARGPHESSGNPLMIIQFKNGLKIIVPAGCFTSYRQIREWM